MLCCCTSLTNVNLSNFNTNKVKYMSDMFEGCSSLKSLNLANFDTSNVEWMDEMFSGCSSLTSIDLSSFNCGKIDPDARMKDMFKYCAKLKFENVKQSDNKIRDQLLIDLK